LAAIPDAATIPMARDKVISPSSLFSVKSSPSAPADAALASEQHIPDFPAQHLPIRDTSGRFNE